MPRAATRLETRKAARRRLSKLAGSGVAGIEIRRRRQNADDRAIKRLVCEACPFEKTTAQEQREFLVSILGETRPQPFFHHEPRPSAACRRGMCNPRKQRPPHCAIGPVCSTGKN